jgi:hypothetical protein
MVLASLADMDDHLYGTPEDVRLSVPLQPLKPFLGPVPGVMAGSVLGYTVAGQILVIPAYLKDGVRRSLAFEFYTQASYAGSHIEAEWLALLTQRTGWVRTSFVQRYPGHQGLTSFGFPAHWADALSRIGAKARPMPPDAEFDELADRLGPKLEAVLLGTLEPAVALAEAQRSFDEDVHLKTRRTSAKWTAVGWSVLAAFAVLLGFGLWRLIGALREELGALTRVSASSGGVRHLDIGLALFLPAVARHSWACATTSTSW